MGRSVGSPLRRCCALAHTRDDVAPIQRELGLSALSAFLNIFSRLLVGGLDSNVFPFLSVFQRLKPSLRYLQVALAGLSDRAQSQKFSTDPRSRVRIAARGPHITSQLSMIRTERQRLCRAAKSASFPTISNPTFDRSLDQLA